MNRVFVFMVAFFIAFLSCSPKKENQNTSQSINIEKPLSIFDIKEKVHPKFEPILSKWKEYEAFEDFLTLTFQNVSKDQILSNSEELNKLSKHLRDSVLPEKINDLSLQARTNLLYSETLRLYDMSTIPSILDSEVKGQTEKVFNAFSSLNAKINAMLEQQELERLYGDSVDYFLKLSKTSVDTSSLKQPKIKTDIPTKHQTKKASEKKIGKLSAVKIKPSKNE